MEARYIESDLWRCDRFSPIRNYEDVMRRHARAPNLADSRESQPRPNWRRLSFDGQRMRDEPFMVGAHTLHPVRPFSPATDRDSEIPNTHTMTLTIHGGRRHQ